MKLYEISTDREVLDTWLAESEGEVTPELEALLAEHGADASQKIERVALYIREQKALADAAKVERDRLGEMAARRIKAAESLTSYLHREMDRLGRDRVNGILVTVALQKNGPSIVGEPVRPLEGLYVDAPEFVRYAPASFALDKKALLEAYKAGRPLPEGVSVTQTVGLRIR